MTAAAIAAVVMLGGTAVGSVSRALGAAATSQPTYAFVPHSIVTAPYDQVERANRAMDVNGDGRPDFVIGGEKYLVWYENPADPAARAAGAWPAHLIANGLFGMASLIAARDLNGDGRVDIIVGQTIPGAPVPRQMAWYENTGAGFVRHSLSTDQNCHHLVFGDLNKDGLEDIACAGGSNDFVFWLERPANVNNVWPDHVLDGRAVWGARIADIDGDGNLDLVAGRAWYRNPGPSGSKVNWQRYPYTLREDTAVHTKGWAAKKFNDYEELWVKDYNGDGRPDIFAVLFAGSPEGQVSVFLAPSDPLTGSWQEVPLDPGPLYSVHTIAAADFDGTGRTQIAVGEMAWAGYGFGHNPNSTEIYVYRLEGPAADPASWKRSAIASDDIGTHAADAIDLDGDGQFDMISGEENSGPDNPVQNGRPRWWENQTPLPAPPSKPANTAPPALCTGCTWQDSQQVSATDGNWQNADSLARQWYSCDADGVSNCLAISGAIANQLTLVGQAGHTLAFEVTATNGAGSTTLRTASSPVVATGPQTPVNTALPTLCTSCTWQEGQQVSATDGSWQNANSLGRQWFSCDSDGTSNCQAIGGATSNQLTLSGQVGRRLAFEVTGTNGVGSTVARSAASPIVAAAPQKPVNTVAPALCPGCTWEEGQEVTATDGTWQNATSLARQWYDCDPDGTSNCTPIAGQTFNAMILDSGLVGRALFFEVTATNGNGSTAVRTPASPVVQPPPPPPNLAPDPSFEVSPTTYYTISGAGKAVISQTTAHSGSRSWQITGKGTGVTRVIGKYKYISVQPGGVYRATAWFQTSNVGKNATLAINFWSKSGSSLGGTALSPKLSGNQPWTQMMVEAPAPANAAYARIEARLTGTGTLWFDDVYVGKIG
ncbi:MAG TPA: VCBS repeat-containing protein [Gaiellaceae bacterium]|nr:VCBS repeat-containing protein [Gaiellaceae bacterium]